MGADYKKAHKNLISGGGTNGIGAGVVNYFGCFGYEVGQAVEVRRHQVISEAGIMEHLYAVATLPPGAGETYDYDIFLNGNLTALGCQIAGAVAVAANDLVTQIAVVPGDVISIRVTISGAAAVEYHTWGLTIRS